jgi:RNA exonuclease 1
LVLLTRLRYSGITEKMLENVTTTLVDIQKKLIDILHPRTVLIGHSLNSDLTALKLTHPFIIDTAVLYPHPRGPPLKSSLKYLAQKYLNRQIQKEHGTTGPGAGHDSIEDARTCLDLVKQKCEKGKEWGTSDSVGENIFKRVARAGVKYKNQGGSAIPSPINGRSSAMVDWGEPKKGAGAAATYSIGCKSDVEVAAGVIRAVNGDHDGKEIPGGGVDFVFGRLRELEALKGWWNNNKAEGAKVADAGTNEAKSEPTNADNHVLIRGGTLEGVLEDIKGMEVAESKPVSVEALTQINEKPALQAVLNEASCIAEGLASEPPSDVTQGEVQVSTAVSSETSAVELPSVIEPQSPASSTMPPSSITNGSSLSGYDKISPETPISAATSDLVNRLLKIYNSLPPCTAFIIYSGSGDPREMSRLQAMQAQFKKEYKIKKWDQLSVKWTDTEEQALKRAVREARNGIAFITVK